MTDSTNSKGYSNDRTSISGLDSLSKAFFGESTNNSNSAPSNSQDPGLTIKTNTQDKDGYNTPKSKNHSSPPPHISLPSTASALPSISNTENNSTTAPQKIVEEFQYLLEKSQQLFLGLRELSPIGGRQWQPYFQRTFEIYTKLWKFQQVHRSILESKDHYGLKRWEVGEIASKIGQLYYHYYLRTSETNYLHEAYIFYEAILERAYFKDVLDAKNSAQMIKKLRYYARFIVVGLLLLKKEKVTKLLSELTLLVEEYTKTFKPVDSMEWQMVLQEISTFLEADRKLVPFAINTAQPLPIQNRLPNVKPVDTFKNSFFIGNNNLQDPKISKSSNLRLQEVIIMGNNLNQLKFSELTLDMYRMVLTLEREPSHVVKPLPISTPGTIPQTSDPIEDPMGSVSTQPFTHNMIDPRPKSNSLGLTSTSPSTRRTTNPPPHKHMLFRPALGQLLIYIANAYREIGENSVFLIYLSAEGVKASPREGSSSLGYSGGCATAFRKPVDKSADVADSVAAIHCLHPGDLVPFTRKPLLLIVDSNNSHTFKSIPRLFNQPLLCLMSPVESPFKESAKTGSLLTMFLYSPLVAFCHIADLNEIDPETWTRLIESFLELEESAVDCIIADVNVDSGVKRFLSDDFLKSLVSRYLICYLIISAHRLTKDAKHLPTCSPLFPPEVLSAPVLLDALRAIIELTNTSLIFSNILSRRATSPQSTHSGRQSISPVQHSINTINAINLETSAK